MADTLLHLENSQSQAILWLLEELGVPYNTKLYVRETSGIKRNQEPESLKETHPLGKSPQLMTPEGRIIIEPMAISMYLIERYDTEGRFQIPSSPPPPAGTRSFGSRSSDGKHNSDGSSSRNEKQNGESGRMSRADDGNGKSNSNITTTNYTDVPPTSDPECDAIREEELIGFATSTLNPTAVVHMMFWFMRQLSPAMFRPVIAALEFMISRAYLKAELEKQLGYLDGVLAGGKPFLMGRPDPTRADFVVLWFIQLLHLPGVMDISPYPNVLAWHDRCCARPAWQRALQKGNSYDMKLNVGHHSREKRR